MAVKRQFSLAHLLTEVALFAGALGLTRIALTWQYEDSIVGATYYAFGIPWIVSGAVVCWGAAMGGLAGRVMQGMYVMVFASLLLVFFLFLAILLPAIA